MPFRNLTAYQLLFTMRSVCKRLNLTHTVEREVIEECLPWRSSRRQRRIGSGGTSWSSPIRTPEPGSPSATVSGQSRS
jgi:hypothetical protein